MEYYSHNSYKHYYVRVQLTYSLNVGLLYAGLNGVCL